MTAIDTDVNEVQKMFDVNVFGPMRMVHNFHSLLIKAQGTIVNVGSVGGIVPYMYGCMIPSPLWLLGIWKPRVKYGAASYNATKAALHHWGNTLRVEMAPLG